jgi:hypothetical protein
MPYSFATSRPDQSTLVGPTSYGPAPVVRDPLDSARSLIGRDPGATYPAGYVDSAITSRRSDPYDSTSLWNTRPYDRGVHASTKLAKDAYVWPAEFNLSSALRNQQMRSQPRYVAPGIVAGGEPPVLVNYGKNAPVQQGHEIDPVMAQQLGRFAPPWR